MHSGYRHRMVLSAAVVLGLVAATGCGGGGGGSGDGEDDLDAETTVMESDPSWEGEDIELEFWTTHTPTT